MRSHDHKITWVRLWKWVDGWVGTPQKYHARVWKGFPYWYRFCRFKAISSGKTGPNDWTGSAPEEVDFEFSGVDWSWPEAGLSTECLLVTQPSSVVKRPISLWCSPVSLLWSVLNSCEPNLFNTNSLMKHETVKICMCRFYAKSYIKNRTKLQKLWELCRFYTKSYIKLKLSGESDRVVYRFHLKIKIKSQKAYCDVFVLFWILYETWNQVTRRCIGCILNHVQKIGTRIRNLSCCVSESSINNWSLITKRFECCVGSTLYPIRKLKTIREWGVEICAPFLSSIKSPI